MLRTRNRLRDHLAFPTLPPNYLLLCRYGSIIITQDFFNLPSGNNFLALIFIFFNHIFYLLSFSFFYFVKMDNAIMDIQ